MSSKDKQQWNSWRQKHLRGVGAAVSPFNKKRMCMKGYIPAGNLNQRRFWVVLNAELREKRKFQ